MQHPSNLVWIDMEMTGLSPDNDRIIEIASVVTDAQLNILAQGPVLAIKQSLECLVAMDEWNTRTHTKSGLVQKVRESKIDEQQAESETLEFIKLYVPTNESPLCGNSVCQDRRFMHRLMPKLEKYLHYRNLDVSSVNELVQRWRPDLINGFKKRNTHRALDDILESIEELKYYRKVFINDLAF
ncbi:MAG: oligoribonuclease [Gammaproteobacteria bacterium]|nr:oligoribonuclease [Gammaproteobacteria bacterium]MCY4218606.1 oligoribonuclease [Gammaproteobacteria bacterium]MCY4275510.1 oligoribonuclease [Gammaproteobacteria bacterium]